MPALNLHFFEAMVEQWVTTVFSISIGLILAWGINTGYDLQVVASVSAGLTIYINLTAPGPADPRAAFPRGGSLNLVPSEGIWNPSARRDLATGMEKRERERERARTLI